MARDKRNYNQHTPKQLKRKCEAFLRSNQDFSKYNDEPMTSWVPLDVKRGSACLNHNVPFTLYTHVHTALRNCQPVFGESWVRVDSSTGLGIKEKIGSAKFCRLELKAGRQQVGKWEFCGTIAGTDMHINIASAIVLPLCFLAETVRHLLKQKHLGIHFH